MNASFSVWLYWVFQLAQSLTRYLALNLTVLSSLGYFLDTHTSGSRFLCCKCSSEAWKIDPSLIYEVLTKVTIEAFKVQLYLSGDYVLDDQ